MDTIASTEVSTEAKKPMKTWKKVALGALALFAVFVPIKFYEDSYNDRSSACTFYGGTAAPRGYFATTPSCTWPSQTMQRQVSFMGTSQPGIDIAVQYCRIYKGKMARFERGQPAVCSFS